MDVLALKKKKNKHIPPSRIKEEGDSFSSLVGNNKRRRGRGWGLVTRCAPPATRWPVQDQYTRPRSRFFFFFLVGKKERDARRIFHEERWQCIPRAALPVCSNAVLEKLLSSRLVVTAGFFPPQGGDERKEKKSLVPRLIRFDIILRIFYRGLLVKMWFHQNLL